MAKEQNHRERVRAVFDAYKKESDFIFRANLTHISRNLQSALQKGALWRKFLIDGRMSEEKIDGWAREQSVCSSKVHELFYKLGELLDDAAFGNLLAQKSVARYDRTHGFEFRNLADRLYVDVCVGLESGRPVHLMARDLVFFSGLYGAKAVVNKIEFEKLPKLLVPVSAEYYFFASISDGICRAEVFPAGNEKVTDNYGSGGPKQQLRGDVNDWGNVNFDPNNSGDYDFLQPL